MPRKKKDEFALPDDLVKLLDDDSQDDLRDPEQVAKDVIHNQVEDSLREAYRVVANTEHGQAVLRHILSVSGFHLDPASFSSEVCLYAAARRAVWVDIRKRLPSQLLAPIENPLEVTR